ncbi:MAG: ribonuclease P protein subunit [bacterium]|nr:ribonuclease P protein subunit [bacterium]
MKPWRLRQLPFHELIGLRARVLAAENPANVGIEGIIIDETRKYLNISGKLVKKEGTLLLVELDCGTRILISGNLLLAHPIERTKHLLEAEKYAKRSFRLQST